MLEQLDQLGEHLATAVREDFPIGAEIAYTRCGNTRTGVIQGYVAHDDQIGLRVLAHHRHKLTDVRLYENPRVIAHA